MASLGKTRLSPIDGMVPSMLNIPAGCGFAPRCPHAMGICTQQFPELLEVDDHHTAACWLYKARSADV